MFCVKMYSFHIQIQILLLLSNKQLFKGSDAKKYTG